MLRIVFTLMLFIHGFIHLLGFLKAYKLAQLEQLTMPISKPVGIVWLISTILFLITLFLFIFQKDVWWMAGLTAIILSQIVIIFSWNDAKYGTIPNFIILLLIVIAYGVWNFNRYAALEQQNIFSELTKNNSKLELSELDKLPQPVRNWIINSGAVGKEKVFSVRLEQSAKIRLESDQVDWYDGKAIQYFSIEKPAFIWTVDLEMNPFVFVKGRDLFVSGKGKMLIKLYSLFSVVDVSNEKINEGTMQRYLGEIVWFPSAAICSYINWKSIDSLSAEVTMTYNGVSVNAAFFFDESGEFKRFEALRYMGADDKAEKYPWVITSNKNECLNGIKIPVAMDVTWKLPKGDFHWLKVQLTKIDYNI
jgi:hypothetical protein